MSNIITAIINLVNSPDFALELKNSYMGRNRANNMGESLEEYVKDLFASNLNEIDPTTRLRKVNEVFSYLGNQNNPPDSILRGGDAIEVKKIESKNSALALNSSYPKAKLFANSSMITESCRSCEPWVEKDIIYAVGVLDKSNRLTQLCMVYGMDYAADESTYTRIKDAISTGVTSIPNIEFAETNELGRVNRVDPLGITYLRVRGMWGIENPWKVFNYIYQPNPSRKFNFMALINTNKYDKLEGVHLLEMLANSNEHLKIMDVEIKNPNNPAQLRTAKLVTFEVY